MAIERRLYKRYPLSGRVEFQTASKKATGKLVDIVKGGALIRSDVKPSRKSIVTARFQVQDYPGVIEVRGRVLRIKSINNTWAMQFLEAPATLEELLRWRSEAARMEEASPIGTSPTPARNSQKNKLVTPRR